MTRLTTELDAPSASAAGAPPEPGVARRILVLAPFAPHADAAHGGARVIAELVAHLAERHRVALLHLTAPGEPAADARLCERCDVVEAVPLAWPRTMWGRAWRAARARGAMVRGDPPWVSAWRSAAFARRTGELARAWRADVVQLEFHVMGQYATALDAHTAPRVLTVHEPGVLAAEGRTHAGEALSRLAARVERRAWARYERTVLARVNAAVVFTERDREALAPLAGATSLVRIPFGVALPAHALDARGDGEPTAIFVGSFAHPPNVDAAVRLGRAIWPRVAARVPGARLFLVGEAPPRAVRALAGAHVVVTGRVAEVEPYLARAQVVVAPLRLGGGMRVKVLEALAAGKAVVASPLACAGLDLTPGVHALVAERDDDLADAIVALLADAERRIALGTAARAWAGAHQGWAEVVRGYERLYNALLRPAAVRP